MRWRRRKSCERFAAWLDSGRPPAGATEVLGHTAECAECTARATAESELEALLASAPPPAPPGFTTAVMARVSATRPQPVLLSPNLLPLWVRAVADPACALPLVASALLLGGFDRIPELGGVIASSR